MEDAARCYLCFVIDVLNQKNQENHGFFFDSLALPLCGDVHCLDFFDDFQEYIGTAVCWMFVPLSHETDTYYHVHHYCIYFHASNALSALNALNALNAWHANVGEMPLTLVVT